MVPQTDDGRQKQFSVGFVKFLFEFDGFGEDDGAVLDFEEVDIGRFLIRLYPKDVEVVDGRIGYHGFGLVFFEEFEFVFEIVRPFKSQTFGSLLHFLFEVDFVLMVDEILSELHLPGFSIKLNNRKVLSGIAEISGETERLVDITVAIDKLDKIGFEGVTKELV